MKIVLVRPPLEVHSRGLAKLAAIMREQGQEVVMLGAVSAREAIAAAVQEDAAIVGFSCYCGGETEYAQGLLNEAAQQGYGGELWAGGLVSERLRDMGLKLPIDIEGRKV